uniref:Predicted protein n=1 Tax=Hordeum vulgare subsp. vulgare TaxID=112509 RepID=F2E2R8_HORVV|nr:predicted protein [Hordeum vulgare subsp. vulgare]
MYLNMHNQHVPAAADVLQYRLCLLCFYKRTATPVRLLVKYDIIQASFQVICVTYLML